MFVAIKKFSNRKFASSSFCVVFKQVKFSYNNCNLLKSTKKIVKCYCSFAKLFLSSVTTVKYNKIERVKNVQVSATFWALPSLLPQPSSQPAMSLSLLPTTTIPLLLAHPQVGLATVHTANQQCHCHCHQQQQSRCY